MASPLYPHRWEGDDPPLVALHGFGGSGLDMEPLQKSAGLEITAPDLLGHGRSPGSTVAKEHGLEAQLDSVLTLLEQRPFLLGYSMGARLALHVAIREPALVRGLVLIGGTPGLPPGPERGERQRWDRQMAEDLRRLGTRTFMDRWATLPPMKSQGRHMDPEVYKAMVERRAAGDPETLAASMEGFGRGAMPDAWEALDTLDTPTLLVVGQEDARHLDIAREMDQRLPAQRRAGKDVGIGIAAQQQRLIDQHRAVPYVRRAAQLRQRQPRDQRLDEEQQEAAEQDRHHEQDAPRTDHRPASHAARSSE